LKREPWRKRAVDYGFHSIISVPLTFDEYSYGVLSVYADEPDVFGDLEREVFAELGARRSVERASHTGQAQASSLFGVRTDR
jgi:GAF domain-containing protein